MSRFQLRPTLTIQGTRNVINIGIDVIRLLGEPGAVCLLQSIDGTSVAITPCDPEDNMSFKVPEKFLTESNIKFQICSKQFVRQVRDKCCLEDGKAYTFFGRYDEERNAVVFVLK